MGKGNRPATVSAIGGVGFSYDLRLWECWINHLRPLTEGNSSGLKPLEVNDFFSEGLVMAAVYGLNVQPEGDARARTSVDFAAPIRAINPVNDGGTGWSGVNGGVRVDSANFPKTVIYGHPKRTPPSDFENAFLLTVSECVKELVEKLEPSVHQFFPVEFVSKKRELIQHRYWFVVCNRIDSVNRQHTKMVLYKGKRWCPVSDLVTLGEPIPSDLSPTIKSKIVFDLAAIGRAHMWKDKHLDGGGIWISEAMATCLQAESVTGLDWGSRNWVEAI